MDSPPPSKRCSGCGEEKSSTEFHRNKTQPSGLHNRCKVCRRGEAKTPAAREYQRRYKTEHQERLREQMRAWQASNRAHLRAYEKMRRYGLSMESLAALIASQDNTCAICGTLFGDDYGTRPHVDHDHACCPGWRTCGGCIRGVLCTHCNKGLGLLGDTIEGVERAMVYLLAAKEPRSA